MIALRWRVLGIYAALTLGVGGRAAAGVVAFTVDPAVSSMRLAGGYAFDGGIHVLQEPVSGSLHVPFGGTLLMEVGTSPFGFRGGDITAQIGGEYLPGPQSANYGFTSVVPEAGGTLRGLLRDFAFSIQGEPTPLFNGFDMLGTTVQAQSGVFDSDLLPDVMMAGRTTQVLTGSGTVFTSGHNIRIQLPMSISFEMPVSNSNLIMQVSFVGMIVARGVAPEPATGVIFLVGLAVLFVRRRAR